MGGGNLLVSPLMRAAASSLSLVATPPPEVLVFKTSVRRRKHVQRLAPLLNPFGRWNFALDDCDRILRVETCPCYAPRICELLARHGFLCEELPD